MGYAYIAMMLAVASALRYDSVNFSGSCGDMGAVAVASVCRNRLVGVAVSSVALG